MTKRLYDKALVFSLVLILILLLFCSQIYASEIGRLIFYEDFEEIAEDGRPIGWTRDGFVVLGEARLGNGSLFINDDSETSYVLANSPIINVLPGTRYTLSAWCKTDDLIGDGSSMILFIYQRDNEGKGCGRTRSITFKRSLEWIEGKITFITDPNAYSIYLCVYPAAAAGVDKIGKMWLDELQIVEGDSALTLWPQPENALIYPNPFYESFKIPYFLKRSSSVEFSVYDESGKVLYTQEDSIEILGYNEFQWDGRDLNGNEVPIGIYICTVSIKDSDGSIIQLSGTAIKTE